VGAGDVYGQAVSHCVASGMGGIRTAGDLVARMQITRGMRLAEAKNHVAGKLGVSAADLSDPVLMLDARKQLGLGTCWEGGEICAVDEPLGLQAKYRIADLLGVPINSVQRFEAMTARGGE
jgi:dimethylamine---corrinoid protein Co-methyltransferase